MEKTVLKVDGMSCEHCVKAVTGAVSGVPGTANVHVDLDGGTVTFEFDAAQGSLEKIAFEIEEQGYTVLA